MKNILVTDFICVEAHKVMNINMIGCIADNAHVDVISVNGFYDNVEENWRIRGIHVIKAYIRGSRKGPFNSRIFSLKVMDFSSQCMKRKSYDLVISLGFETFGYIIKSEFSRKVPVALLHHKNLDEISHKKYKIVFNLYKNKVHHLVFEDFFAEHLICDHGVEKNRVHVIPHPILDISAMNVNESGYDCVGLCNSNSEEFINSILEIKDDFNQEGLCVLLRSRERKGTFGSIDIISGYLESDEYTGYLDGARSVLVAIPDNYVYRLSGSIYDALSRKKMVFTTSKYYGENYGMRYFGICVYVKDEKDFLDKLKKLKNNQNLDYVYQKFIDNHSMNYVRIQMGLCIKRILEEER